MKLQLKRSNQVTGLPGSEIALPPTVANTEFGEISVNYNEYDPALFCKLDNGDIIRLGGATDDYLLTSTGTATTGQIVLTHDPVGTKAATTDSINITGGTGVTIDGSTGNTINITIDGSQDIGVDLNYIPYANYGEITNTAGNGVTIDAALGGVRAGLITAVNQEKLDRVVDPGSGQTTDDRYVQRAGDSMTGNLELSTNVDIIFEGSTANNFETTLTVVDPTADNTLALPNVSGNLVSTGDTGTVSSTMITDQTIVNNDISNSANISVSKLGEGSANQVLVTDSAGNAVIWANELNLSGGVTASSFDTSQFQVAAVSGNTSIGGTLTVTDQATFNGGISADGAFSVANDTGNVSTTGTLTVADQATFNGGLSADGAFSVANDTGDVSTTGSLTVSNLATFNGGISADGAFSVANDTGNVSTTGSLTVNQLATFNGGISADGAFSVANDTGNVSTTGSLDVSGLASLDGGIDVDGAFTVSDTTGNISTTGTLTVTDQATFNGGLSADGAFSVANDSGNVSTTGSLTVSQLATFNGGISADGAFSVANDTGNVSTTGSLTVSSLATFNGGISSDGAFSVANTTGNISTTGSLDVSGLASLDGGIDVDGAFTVSDTTGNISTTGSLTVSQFATFNGGLSADGAFSVANDTGNVSTTGSLDVSGLASLDGGIDVDGAFTVSDTTGNISTTGTLGVSGLISANGKLSFPLGSQSTPSIYPGTDSDTGIYSPAVDTFAITTNGVERARFSATGNFGINATNPLSLLQVGQARFEVSGLTAERIYTYPDAAGTVALTSSNVATASAWENARTITLGGDTTGAVSIDGSSNVTLNVTVSDDSHNHTIANVDNLQTTLDAKADLVSGVIPTSQIPALAVTEFLGTVSSQTAMLALTGQKGDWCNRTDVSSTFIITGTDPTQISSWTELDYPAADVTSVNSQTGAVVLSASDLGLGNVDNTSDLNKPISSATQTALNGKLGSTANAASASKWNSARTINLGGDLSGAVSIDGSSNVTLNGQVADDSHNHIIANVDGLQAALDAKLGHSGKAADSELLDGINSTSFLRRDTNNSFTSTITGNTLILGGSQITTSSAVLQVNGFSRQGTIFLHDLTNNVDATLANSNGTLQWSGNQVWTSANDGSGSTLDADLLDGQQGSFYQNASNLNAGTIPDTCIADIGNSGARIITFDNLEKGDFGGDGQLGFDSSQGLLVYRAQQGTSGAATTVLDGWNVAAGTNISITNLGAGDTATGEFTFSVTQGSGSGLDADLLDGVQGASFLRSDANDYKTGGFLRFNDNLNLQMGTDNDISFFYNGNDFYMDFQTAGDSWYIRDSGDNAVFGFSESGNLSLYKGDLNVGDGGDNSRILIKKADNNVSDHIQFYNGTTRMGEIGVQDTTWLRINQVTNKNIYTPRYIRADGGFFVDGTTYGINGTGVLLSNTGATIGGNAAWHAGNDGSGSGLDADLLDGVQGANYVRNNSTTTISARHRFNHNEINNSDTIATATGSLGALEVYNSGSGNDAFMCFHTGGDHAFYFGLDADTNDLSMGGWSKGANKYRIWHAGNDGSGSGLDADLLDGIQGASFLRSDANDTLSAIITGHASNTEVLRVRSSSYSSNYIYIGGWSSANSTDISRIRSSSNLHIDSPSDGSLYFNWYAANRTIYLGNTGQTVYAAGSNIVWHAGNDGAGSGLDADTVDGIQGSALAPIASPTFTGNLTIPDKIIHAGDTDTYLQFHGANLARFVIAGAEVQEWGNNYTLLSDNDQVRLGTGSDFRMWFNGADTYFRNYAHANGDIIFQGENSGGTNQNLLILKTDGARSYCVLYENSQARLTTTSGGVSISGTLTATGNVTAYSDIKLKKNIEVIPDALSKVSRLRGVTFDRKDLKTKRQSGVIAQEVEAVLPEVVDTDEEGIKSVAYGNMIGLLIESIKELKAEVETLKAEKN